MFFRPATSRNPDRNPDQARPRTGHSIQRLSAAWTLAALAVAPATAQVTGQLTGQVVDADGAPLPGASVSVGSPRLMGLRTDFADDDGAFRFPSLPPGVYTVEAELDGFLPLGRNEVQVRVGRVTRLRLELAVGEFAEDVLVLAETPVVDPEQASTSQTFTAEWLKKAAVGSSNRGYQDVLSSAAGVAGGSNPNVFGSTSSENAWLIDGTDTTDPVTGTYNINLDFDAILEINFETGGFEARHGRATGGVINVVTKSGGNEFSGSVDIRYRNNSFNTNGEHFDKNRNITEKRETSVNLGGPFKRDRLWFYAAINPVQSKSTPTRSPTTRKYDGTYSMGKLTWQAHEDWQFVGRYLREDTTIANSNADRDVAPEAASRQEQPNGILNLEALAMPVSNLQWHVKASALRSSLDVTPQSGDLKTIARIDAYGDDTLSVNYPNQQYSDRDRDEVNTSLAWFVDRGIGDHEFRVGADWSDTFFRRQNNATGGGHVFLDRFGQPFRLTFQPVDKPAEHGGELLTAYVQDTWRVSPRLTLKLGVRNDQVAFTNDVGAEIADLSRLQPRLALAWDVKGDARTVVRANWGAFMHPNALSLPSFSRVNSVPTVRWSSCSAFRPELGANCRNRYPGDRKIGGLTFSNWIEDPVGRDPNGWFYDRAFFAEPGVVTPDLKPMYSDTTIVGIERELANRTSLALTWIDKKTRDIFEDTCNGNLPTPSADADCDYFVMANLPMLARDYRGVTLDFETRLTDWMWIMASWTRSESKGNIGNTRNAGTDFDIYPDHFVNRYGYLNDHRKHRVKVNGFVDLPLDFTLGFDAYWSSPSVYTPLRDADSYGDLFVEPRGSREFVERYDLDIQLTKGFDFAGGRRFELIAAMNNLFDDEQGRSVCEDVEGCSGGLKLGDPGNYHQPRWYEAGVRFEF